MHFLKNRIFHVKIWIFREGALFESMIICEIIKQRFNQDKPSRQIILKGLIIFQKLPEVGYQNHILSTEDWKTSIAPKLGHLLESIGRIEF